MAVSQEDIVARIRQIQQAGGGDTAATRAEIAREAQQYGVDAGQIAGALQSVGNTYTESDIRSMAREAGAAFAPSGLLQTAQDLKSGAITREQAQEAVNRSVGLPETTTGMLGGTNIDLTQQDTPITLGTGMLEGVTTDTTPAGLDDLPNFLGSSLLEKAEQTPSEALGKITENNPSSIANLGSFIYQANKEGTKIPSSLIEEIGYSVSPDTTEAYNFAVHAQSVAEGYDALEKAIAAGDTAKATELRNALQAGEQNFGSYWNYYNQNIAASEGQAHGNLRKKTTTGDTIFGVGDPKGGFKGSIERGVVRLGDAIGDVVDNPYVQAAVSFVYPPAGAVLNAYATLDSGENLSPAQIAAALAGANDMIPGGSNLGNQVLSQLPESVQKFVQAAQEFADGATGRAVAALKQAFPNVDTEKLAEYEDNFKTFLAGGEDVIREVVGDENIEAISSNIAGLEDTIRAISESTGDTYQEVSNRLAGVEDFIRENIGDDNIEAISGGFANFEDFIRGQFGTQQDQIDELVAALSADQGGTGFTPQRGYQPGLAVDTEFDMPERSAVLDILNQPSSVRRA